MTTGQPADAELLREFGATEHNQLGNAAEAGAVALDEVATLRANEGEQLRSLSDALSGGNAATWDEVIDAAATLRARVAQLEQALRDNQDETWAGAVTYVRDMAKTIRSLTQRFVADGAIAELATVRAEALEECADGMERAAKKARAALTPSPEETTNGV